MPKTETPEKVLQIRLGEMVAEDEPTKEDNI